MQQLGWRDILNYISVQNRLASAHNGHNLDLNSGLSEALKTAPSFE